MPPLAPRSSVPSMLCRMAATVSHVCCKSFGYFTSHSDIIDPDSRHDRSVSLAFFFLLRRFRIADDATSNLSGTRPQMMIKFFPPIADRPALY